MPILPVPVPNAANHMNSSRILPFTLFRRGHYT